MVLRVIYSLSVEDSTLVDTFEGRIQSRQLEVKTIKFKILMKIRIVKNYSLQLS